MCVLETTSVGISEPRGGSKREPSSVVVRPNPAINRISLDAAPTGIARVVVRDVAGREVKRECLECPPDGNLVVDVAGLQAGLYFLELETRDGRYVLKLVKQ